MKYIIVFAGDAALVITTAGHVICVIVGTTVILVFAISVGVSFVGFILVAVIVFIINCT
jgi:hypothetical protein